MDEKELKEYYDKLVARIESASMFDGRGKGVDVYVCDRCGKQFLTRYKDKGVTPFTLKCRITECGATMVHRGTISEEEAYQCCLAVHNWVRPTFEQLLKLNADDQKYVLKGGLMLEEELENDKSIVKEKFDQIQEQLESLKDKDATCLFIGHEGYHFVMSGNPAKIKAQIVFAMCRYPVVKDIIKTCATRFDEINKKYGDELRDITMDHLIEQNSGNE